MPVRCRNWLILLITLVGFGLRVHWLEHQSLWSDEGWSIYHASRPTLQGVLLNTSSEGTNPPLPYLLLHVWLLIGGKTVFAMRFLPVMLSTLTVPLLASVGRRLGNFWVGLAAASLLAISPFHLYYSQELRAYAQLTLGATLSSYLFLRALAQPASWRAWSLCALANTALLYTHYYGAFGLAAQGLYGLGGLIVNLWRNRQTKQSLSTGWRPVLLGLGNYGLAAGTLLPWFYFYAWGPFLGLLQHGQPTHFTLARIAARLLAVFSLGFTWPLPETLWPLALPLLPFMLLLGLGSSSLWRGRTWFCLTWLTVPVLSVAQLGLAAHADWTRFFITASPAFYLLSAQGLADAGRLAGRWAPTRLRPVTTYVVGGGLLALLGALTWPSLNNYYTNPLYARTDIKSLANRIAALPDSLVIGNTDLLTYYLAGRVAQFSVPCPVADPAALTQRLPEVIANRNPIWLVRQPDCDPQNHVPYWLALNTFPAEDFWLGPLNMTVYHPATLTQTGQNAGRLGDTFELRGWGIDQATLAPGETLHVALTWTSALTPTQDYRAFVFLVNQTETLAAIHDSVPVAWFRPTPTWQAEELIEDHHSLTIDPNAPAGDYWLGAGLYAAATGERLPVTAGASGLKNTALRLTTIHIGP